MALHTKVDGERLDGEYLGQPALRPRRRQRVRPEAPSAGRADGARHGVDMFLDDLKRLLPRLEKQPSPAHDDSYASVSH